MKKINVLLKNLGFVLIFLMSVNWTALADPYVAALCIPSCLYFTADSKYGMCTGDILELYATNPKAVIPCVGSRQWYTFVYGFHCVDFMCHYGYYATAIDGATSNKYTVTEAGKYWCTVDCGSGAYNTDTVEFFYSASGPAISSQPESQNKCLGSDATFSLSVSDAVFYQWQKKVSGTWTDINGATLSSYSYTPLIGDNLSKFQCRISNGCGIVYSNEVTLTVNSLPTVELGTDKHICEGSDLVLDAGANLTGYNWSTGETTRTITVNAEAGYSVTVTDNNNCSNSDNIYIYIDPKIQSLDLGIDKNICLGNSVELNPGSGYDNYLWNTGANSQSVIITEEGTYSVQVSNNGNVCIVTDTILVSYTRPYEDEEIGLVTVDLESGDNLVVWERTMGKGTDYYEIYRGSEGNELYLGQVDFAASTVFRDIGTFDDGISYRYKILVVDTCGSKSQYSSSHKTMHLTASKGVTNEVNLAWNHYEGFPVAWYYIYRGTDSAKLQPYDSIQYDLTTTAKTDYNPPAGVAYYRIGVKAPRTYVVSSLNKTESGPYSHSMSNIEDNRFQTGISKMKSGGELTIYPNPATDYVTIRFLNPKQKEYQLVVRDLTGKAVLMINNITKDETVIERGNLKAGYYSVEVTGEKLYRGKLIIE